MSQVNHWMVDARRKGAQYERDVAHWLEDLGIEAGRTGSAAASRGSYHDTYDLWAELPITIECKNQKAMELSGWVAQAVAQADEFPGVVVHKKRGTSDVGKHYATMRFEDLIWLIQICSSGSLPHRMREGLRSLNLPIQ